MKNVLFFNEALTYARLHPINTIKPRERKKKRPFKVRFEDGRWTKVLWFWNHMRVSNDFF